MRSDHQQTGRSPSQVADHNSRILLEALRRAGSLTRNELAARLGLTIPGITNVTRRLLGDGLILENRRKTAAAQMPSTHYAIDPDGAFAVGMRWRGTEVEGILLDLGGEIRGRQAGPDVEGTVAALRDVAGPLANIVGVGWAIGDETPSEDPIVSATTPVVASTLAEWSFGGVPANGLVVILIEDRVGAGLFFNGTAFSGANGRAGRIGEMRTGSDRRRLNDVASAASYRRVRSGEAAQRLWAEHAAKHLLDAVFALTGFLGPARVAIAGDLPAPIVEQLIAEMKRLSATREREATALELPDLSAAIRGGDSVLIGAAMLPFFAKLLPAPIAGDIAPSP